MKWGSRKNDFYSFLVIDSIDSYIILHWKVYPLEPWIALDFYMSTSFFILMIFTYLFFYYAILKFYDKKMNETCQITQFDLILKQQHFDIENRANKPEQRQ